MSTDRKPYIVGITGGIASGKTTATDYLQSLGAMVLDADVESREVTAPGGRALPAIRAYFGDGVFCEDGTLDRRALGRIVFSDIAQRHALEAIIHPMVQHKMLSDINEAGRKGANKLREALGKTYDMERLMTRAKAMSLWRIPSLSAARAK